MQGPVFKLVKAPNSRFIFTHPYCIFTQEDHERYRILARLGREEMLIPTSDIPYDFELCDDDDGVKSSAGGAKTKVETAVSQETEDELDEGEGLNYIALIYGKGQTHPLAMWSSRIPYLPEGAFLVIDKQFEVLASIGLDFEGAGTIERISIESAVEIVPGLFFVKEGETVTITVKGDHRWPEESLNLTVVNSIFRPK